MGGVLVCLMGINQLKLKRMDFFFLLNSDYSQMLEGAKHVLTKTSIAPQPCACLLAGVECGNCQKAKQP